MGAQEALEVPQGVRQGLSEEAADVPLHLSENNAGRVGLLTQIAELVIAPHLS